MLRGCLPYRYHFDDIAAKLLSKTIPILCQTEDAIKLQSYGFTNIHPIHTSYIWNDITFHRTNGKHGHDEIAIQMAPVSGFVISSTGESSVYIAGDTVWCEEVEKSIEKFQPEIIVCNCGGAQFSYGEPITMTTKDIHELCHRFPNIKVVAVHMEAWNHCRLSRKKLKHYIKMNTIHNYVAIPQDGESLSF